MVECNEDGFTRENLVAICSIGKSSKSGAQGYTGEKGIGFKSVFMVAWKVLIQSGDFSFYFQHKKGDSGMGMISPIWEDGSDNITDPLTRITLFLHDSLSDDTTETMLQQFNEIDAIMLLFLRNLKRIDVRMYDSNDRETQFTTYSISRQADNRVELNTERVKKGKTKIYSNNYISISHIAKDLPKSENREYSDEEIAQRAFAKAEVILAFPLNDDGTPIIKAQQIFAFLPIKTEGFSVE